jgi:hypothetical protein
LEQPLFFLFLFFFCGRTGTNFFQGISPHPSSVFLELARITGC